MQFKQKKKRQNEIQQYRQWQQQQAQHKQPTSTANKTATPAARHSRIKKRWYVLGIAAVVLVGGIGGHYWWKHHAVGTNPRTVHISKSRQADVNPHKKNNANQYDVKRYGKNITLHGYTFLYEKNIPRLNHHKREMPAAKNFTASLLNCFVSGTREDVSEGGALWLRNSKNYNFTSPQNLINKGIGTDLMHFHQFQENTHGLSPSQAYDYNAKMGKYIRQQFSTPMTMAIGALSLTPDGQITCFTSNDSALSQYWRLGISYQGMVQYRTYHSLKHAPLIPEFLHPGHKVNYAQQAWKSIKHVNSVYQIKVTDNKYVDHGYVYIVETNDGKLHPFGYFSMEPDQRALMTVGQYRAYLLQHPDYHQKNATGNDLTWNNFVNQMDANNE